VTGNVETLSSGHEREKRFKIFKWSPEKQCPNVEAMPYVHVLGNRFTKGDWKHAVTGNVEALPSGQACGNAFYNLQMKSICKQ
jgi:hypothetical protein